MVLTDIGFIYLAGKVYSVTLSPCQSLDPIAVQTLAHELLHNLVGHTLCGINSWLYPRTQEAVQRRHTHLGMMMESRLVARCDPKIASDALT